jgi:septal ring factor EnvC (AmiA/AmiB activator)
MIATISGTVTTYVRGNTATGRGNEVVITNGSTQVKYCHLNRIDVANGSRINEGQQIGLCGWTGYVLPKSPAGSHLHFEVLQNGSYVNPETQYNTTPPPVAGGNNMFQTDAEVQEAYLLLRGNPGTAAERAGWIGQSKQRFFQVAKPEADATRTALANAQKQVSTLNTQVSTLTTKTTALETQVKSLTAQTTTLTAQIKALTETVASKDKEIADLKSQVATGGSNEDSINLNKLGEALRWVISRLGLK